jgi:hypothetical protein
LECWQVLMCFDHKPWYAPAGNLQPVLVLRFAIFPSSDTRPFPELFIAQPDALLSIALSHVDARILVIQPSPVRNNY